MRALLKTIDMFPPQLQETIREQAAKYTDN